MKMVALAASSLILILVQASALATALAGPIVRYDGCEDVTAAVAIGDDTFVAACRDDNVLRVYSRSGSSASQESFDLSDYLEISPDVPVTIEGATRVGNRIYWITSHGRDEEGRIRPERYRFFATRVERKEGRFTIELLGKPTKTLVHRLVDRHTMRTLRLDKATRFGVELMERGQKRLAPSQEGLHIAALCGSLNAEVLIAFLNPRPLRVISGTAHALIVPLDNAAEMIEKGEDPIFGEGMLWDFEGQGIVAMEYSPFHRAFFLVAAPHNSQGSLVVYRWSGMKANRPEVVERFTVHDQGFFPETIVPFDGSNELLLLGNATASKRDGESGHGLPTIKSFRGYWFRPH